MRWLALLRGVNVGGARSLPMAELERMFRAAGARAAETVIQSGNVIFDSVDAENTGAAAAKAIEAKFGFRPAMILRSAQRWRAMVDANPFVAAAQSQDHLHVACLAVAPDPAAIAPLDAKATAPDEFVIVGADIYLRLPNGVARANLTNARLDKAFRTVSTLRNWRTVLKLLERLEA
jgi:uncharacterized protein (DUF1697 family)